MMDDMKDRLMSGLVGRLDQLVDLSIAKLAAANLCGSPIESALGLALVHMIRINGGVITVCTKDGMKGFPGETLLVPQYAFQNYKIDWAFFHESQALFIECDGHDFHERTKEQAAHDRKRDRAIQDSGFRIFRFTGSEIYKDPVGCAEQIIQSMNTLTAGARKPTPDHTRQSAFAAAQAMRYAKRKEQGPIVRGFRCKATA